MELVTGFAGQAHVDPIDMAHVNAVAFGHDAYLLDTQNKLEPTLETANKLVVDTGDLMIQGHHFTVVQSEEIALQSGVSGQKRNALVCARYDKTEGTGVESASWIVKYGTATTGTPADPSVTTGNILDGVDSVHEEPIFRIEYDGITPGDPILLVPEFQSNAKFRDSISPVGTDDYWTTIEYPNGLHECWMNIGFGGITPSENRLELTLPFTPENLDAVCVELSLMHKNVTSVSHFTDVSLIALLNATNKLTVIAYNSGNTTVFSQVSVHVIERAVY